MSRIPGLFAVVLATVLAGCSDEGDGAARPSPSATHSSTPTTTPTVSPGVTTGGRSGGTGGTSASPVLATVPDVAGLSIGEAVDALARAGLLAHVTYPDQGPVCDGDVASVITHQRPQAGGRLRPRAYVELTADRLLDGRVRVPDLLGATAEEAGAVLTGAFLTPWLAPGVEADDVVTEQDPGPCTVTDRGSSVALFAGEE